MAWKLVKPLRPLCSPRLTNSSRFTGTLFNARLLSDLPSQQPVSTIVNPSSISPHEKVQSHQNGTAKAHQKMKTTYSLKEHELAKFSAIADTWWDPKGPFKPLHAMNPTRLAFIRSTLCRHFKKDPYCARPFDGLKINDVGCGGGVLSEPLARMGATVTGVDSVEKNIKIARLHTADSALCYEILLSSASLAALIIMEGATVISTINRSVRSYSTAIIAAEYLLHRLPKGTHQWSSFLTPEELS